MYDWRYIFLISVPFGLFGTVWSYWKLKELAVIRKNQKIDVWGNVTFGAGLTIFLIAMTYGLLPYNDSPMGWTNPYVIAGLVVSLGLLAAFPFIEMHVEDPMFRLELFKRRAFGRKLCEFSRIDSEGRCDFDAGDSASSDMVASAWGCI